MMDMMVEMVRQPAVHWLVLSGAAIAVIVEAYKASPEALWGDMISDELDD
ncbi:MAG: hypothetical protein AAF719_06880 [Pseudomonadota bacterium]